MSYGHGKCWVTRTFHKSFTCTVLSNVLKYHVMINVSNLDISQFLYMYCIIICTEISYVMINVSNLDISQFLCMYCIIKCIEI